MNYAALQHRPLANFVYPCSRNELSFRLIAARGDIDEARLLYWNRHSSEPIESCSEPVRIELRDAYRDYCLAQIRTESIAAYIRYCFEIHSGGKVYHFGQCGLTDAEKNVGRNYFEFLWPNTEDGFRAPEWSTRQIYYQIFPERFFNGDSSTDPCDTVAWGSVPTRENFMGGDLEGIKKKLSYISELGATCIYLTPVFEAPSNHKYDTVNYYRVDPHFGTNETLKQLVVEAHRLGIKVVLDGVFNHCGFYWPPFQDVIEKGPASKYRDWFFIGEFPVCLDKVNYDCVGHYKWMPKIDLSNPDARRYFIDVGRHWLRECEIDGWRLDVADEVPATFWEEFSYEMRLENPECVLVGETWMDPGKLLCPGRLDSAMNYIFRDAVRDWLAKGIINAEEFAHLANQMLGLNPYDVSLRLYNLLDSHDTPRFLTLCGGSLKKYRLAAALQMIFPGCPAVYYGDEIGMEGETDPDCRRAMEWDAAKQDVEMSAWYRELIKLRKSSEALQIGNFHISCCDNETNMLAICRSSLSEHVLVIINAGSGGMEISAKVPGGCGVWYEAFSSEVVFAPESVEAVDLYDAGYTGKLQTHMPACSVKIFRTRK